MALRESTRRAVGTGSLRGNGRAVRFGRVLLSALMLVAVFAAGSGRVIAAEPPEKPVAEYARDLEAEDPKVRREAAYQLSRPGVNAKQALPQLIKALDDNQQQVWFGAITALANLGPDAEPALPALMAELEAWQPYRKDRQGAQALYRTSLALGSIGAPAVPVLSNALASGKWHVRAGAARALGFAGPAALPVVPGLVSLLSDGRVEVRDSVAETLALMGPAALGPLEAAFREAKDGSGRTLVVTALGRLGPVAAPLAPLIRETILDGGDAGLRAQALDAYRRVAPDAGDLVQVLLRAWDDPDDGVRRAAHSALLLVRPVATVLLPAVLPRLEGPDAAQSARVAGLISELGPDAAAALPVVARCLKRGVDAGKPDPRLFEAYAALGMPALEAVVEELSGRSTDAFGEDDWALEVLRRMNVGVLTPLMGLLEHPVAAVRAGGLEALTALGDRARAAAKRVPPLLGDPDGRVRARAWEAAGACGVAPEVLMTRLEAGLGDAEPAVRRSVVMGLARLGRLAKAAVPKVVEAMGSGDAELELASIRALASMGPEAAPAVPALVAKAGKATPEMQVEVLGALGAVGSGVGSELEPIWGLGDASDARVRLAFLEAAAAFQAAGRPALASIDRSLTDPMPGIRAAAVRARVAVDPESEDGVAAAVRGLDDSDGGVRRAAAEALAGLEERGRPGEARLFAMLGDPGDQSAAKEALRAIHPTSLERLLQALDHGDWGVREMAADALARLGKEAAEAVPALEKRVREDSSEEVKRAARRAVRRIREG